MTDDIEFTASLEKLAFKALDSLYVPGQNLVYSPVSLEFALGMILEGADGQSRKEILDLMFSSGHNNDDQAVERLSNFFTKLLHGDPNDTFKFLKVSNSFYADKRVVFHENFVKTLKDKNKASVQSLDFVNAKNQSVNFINNDAKNATDGTISNLFNSIEKDTLALIVNAMYFKGKWRRPFDKNLTKKRNFRLSNGKVIKVPTMKMKETIIQRNKPLGDPIIKLPFQLPRSQKQLNQFEKSGVIDSEQIYMVIVISRDQSIKEYLKTFNLETFKTSLEKTSFMSESNVTLSMPLFKIESTFSLIPSMKQLGVSQIFTKNANFEKMGRDSIQISDVFQKAIIEVDEEGTVATAVPNLSAAYLKSFRDPRPYIFRVDRPFVYMLIREDESRQRQILFLGVVENPLQD